MTRYYTQKIKAVLCDAGNVLFKYSVDDQTEPLRILLEDAGKKLSIDDVYSSYLPYLHKAQTVISEKKAVEQFLRDNNCPSNFSAYKKIRSLMRSKNKKKYLYEGVTETLEVLRNIKIDFYIVTNAKEPGSRFRKDFKRMLIAQLKERGIYNPKTFNLFDYIKDIISSKDLGVRKPSPLFFDTILSSKMNKPLKRNEVIFIAHNSDEIFGAADLGILVIAFNYQGGGNARSIIVRINNYNEKYENGKSTLRIYTIKKFIEITRAIKEINRKISEGKI